MLDDSDDSEIESDGEDIAIGYDEPVGPNILDFYAIGQEIGRGAFSVVREGYHTKTGKRVAIKSIRNKAIKNKLLMREIEIMKKVDHPNILKLYEVFESKNYLHLVLEHVTGGELFNHIVTRGEYSEKDASSIVRQIISAVAYLHTNNIAHRDLKPQNLLCSSTDGNDIRVADFGLSKMFGNGESLKTCCGSPEYVAPEVLECKSYSKACDMWSVGIITYVLLTGRFPFWHKNKSQLYDLIRYANYGWPPGLEISTEAQDLISHLLDKSPDKRYTAEQALQHQWIAGTGQEIANTKRLTSPVPVRKRHKPN